MKVAVGQFQVFPGEVEKNFKKGEMLIQNAKREQCDIILLPEVWTTGFPFKKLKELSKTTPEILEELKKLSENTMICGSYVVDNPDSDKVFNIFYAIYNGEVTFSYKKIMLFSFTGEDRFFEKGALSQRNTFDHNGMVFGVSICYELRFPEFFRRSSFNGALAHLVPAIWPKPRCRHWQILSETRAIENQFFVLTSNGSISSGKWEMCGSSTIFNPWGEPMKRMESNEVGIITYEIDKMEIEKIRDKFPAFYDSRKNFAPIFSHIK